MCGLVFVSKKDNTPARKAVWKRYEAQKQRGTDGYGFISIKNGKIVNIVRHKHATETEKDLLKETADTILFHHRTPTSTENMVEATHPIEVKNPILEHDYYLAHNGIITNEDELKKEHEAKGFVYTTVIRYKTITRIGKYCAEEFNDSEALAVDMALVLDGKKDKIDARGSIAFICLQVEKGTDKVKSVFYGRNYSNPLNIQRDKDFLSITSTGMGSEVEEDVLFKIDVESGLTTERKLKMGGWHNIHDDDYPPYSPTAANSWNVPKSHSYYDGEGNYHEKSIDSVTAFLMGSKVNQEVRRRAEEAMTDVQIAEGLPELPSKKDLDAAYKDWTELELFLEEAEADLETLEQRKKHLIGKGDEIGELAVIQEIEKKKKDIENYENEMHQIEFYAGAYDNIE